MRDRERDNGRSKCTSLPVLAVVCVFTAGILHVLQKAWDSSLLTKTQPSTSASIQVVWGFLQTRFYPKLAHLRRPVDEPRWDVTSRIVKVVHKD